MPIDALSDLSFARPLWLLLLFPCAALCWLLYRRINQYSPWHRVLPAPMREALLQRQPGRHHAGRFALLAMGWALAVIALSGPVWEGEAPVVRQNKSALVIVLDLSHNMLANDISPTRLERARLKIRDLLQMRSDTQVALIAFAGSAHRVTPLSTDQSTLINLLGGLSPDIMPVSGTETGSALELAEQMIALLPTEGTQVLLITGGVDEEQLQALGNAAHRLGRQLSILGVGTTEGAPVALPEGGFLRDDQGRIVLPRLDNQALAAIARRTGAAYHDITRDDTDLLRLLQPLALTNVSAPDRSSSRGDQGFWLVLLLLPLAAFGARRGWLGIMLCALMLSPVAEAGVSWENLWQTPDQQAAELLDRDQPAAAAERFEDPHWAAWSLYQAGQYTAAAEAYERLLQQDPDNPQHHFDHGTALAMSGDLKDALEAYEQTLTRAPDHAAARHNRSRIEALLEQQARQAAEQSAQPGSEEAKEEEPGEPQAIPEQSSGAASPQPTELHGTAQQSEQPQPSPGEALPAADGAADSTPQPGGATETINDQDSKPKTALTEGDPTPPVPGPSASPPQLEDSLAPLPAAPQAVLEPEQQAALQQWLREVPDNPADLLRRKFLYQRLQQLEERSR